VPQEQWSDKRERQYDHIKSGLKQRGRGEDTAEQIAAPYGQQGARLLR
jgi:hypothetical protein